MMTYRETAHIFYFDVTKKHFKDRQNRMQICTGIYIIYLRNYILRPNCVINEYLPSLFYRMYVIVCNLVHLGVSVRGTVFSDRQHLAERLLVHLHPGK